VRAERALVKRPMTGSRGLSGVRRSSESGLNALPPVSVGHWPRWRWAIVVGVDGSAGSDAAIRWAVGEATLRAAPIILVHVVAPLVVAWPVGRIQGNITRSEFDV
jgi:hypothetical protein